MTRFIIKNEYNTKRTLASNSRYCIVGNMKKIPLHSLVLMVGPSGAGKSTLAKAKFPNYEIVSSDALREELVGDMMRQDLNDTIFAELNRRVELKLALGERVVVDATNLRKRDRMSIVDLGQAAGVPIFYVVVNRTVEEKNKTAGWRREVPGLIERHDQVFKSNERDIMRGDNIATVIDTSKEDFEAVEKFPVGVNLLNTIRARGFAGVTAAGDIHGMLEALHSAIDWAHGRNYFLVFLGDLLDYGPANVEVINMVYDLVMRGRAIVAKGNHEYKIERWLKQVKTGDIRIRLSAANQVTVDQINSLDESNRVKFESRFKALMGASRQHWNIGDTLFTHAAAEPEMFNMFGTTLPGKLSSLAYYGEIDEENKTREDGFPNRIYTWVDRVPPHHKAIVGHDIRSKDAPVVVTGKRGGMVYFMDTGSGKGGRLSTVDLAFKGTTALKVEAITTY